MVLHDSFLISPVFFRFTAFSRSGGLLPADFGLDWLPFWALFDWGFCVCLG